MRKSVLSILLTLLSLNLFSQVTADQLDGNNTSACYTAGGHCQKAFQPMTNTTVIPSDTYNIIPGNLTNASIKNLLYSSSTTQATKDATKVFAHLLGWFCTNSSQSCEGHVETGYNSDDPLTVQAQLDDMQRRGFDGLVLDWYGTGRDPSDPKISSILRIDATARTIFSGITGRPLEFALMEDQGAWNDLCPSTNASCIQSHIIQDITDANSAYFNSPNYLRVSGRPVLFFFISESSFFTPSTYQDTWTQIWSQVASAATSLGNPLLVFRNSVGFNGTYPSNHPNSNGAYAWVNCNGDIRNLTDPKCNVTDPYGFLYLRDFYFKAMSEPVDQQRWGAAWKGYDKSNSAFEQNPAARLPQQCGQTWLKTLRLMTVNPDGTSNNYFGDGHPLDFVQIATWNDYDEGTEIETGIDNCFTFSTTVLLNPNLISWKLDTTLGTYATMNTLDHFEIYYEPTDTGGNNLTLLDGNVAPAYVAATPIPDYVDRRGHHTCPSNDCMEYSFQYDATSFVSTHPHYIYYVRAVGKPGIINKVTNGLADFIVPTRPPRT